MRATARFFVVFVCHDNVLTGLFGGYMITIYEHNTTNSHR